MHAMQSEDQHSPDHNHLGSNGYADGGSSNRRYGKLQLRDTITTVVGFFLPLLTRFGHNHH
jgi:zinc transporter 9